MGGIQHILKILGSTNCTSVSRPRSSANTTKLVLKITSNGMRNKQSQTFISVSGVVYTNSGLYTCNVNFNVLNFVMVQAISENAEKPFYEQVRSSIYILMLKNSALSNSMLLYKHLNHHTRFII